MAHFKKSEIWLLLALACQGMALVMALAVLAMNAR